MKILTPALLGAMNEQFSDKYQVAKDEIVSEQSLINKAVHETKCCSHHLKYSMLLNHVVTLLESPVEFHFDIPM